MAPVFRVRSGAFAASLLATAHIVAGASYGLRATESAERVSRELVEQQVFTELTALLGHGASHERLTRIEDVLRPMYAALPKTEDGGIDQGVARYALSRYFLTYHGWHIVGIGLDGKRWNASSATTMLKSKMPSFTFELLEERLGRKQLGLGELTVLAATVEDLVHSDGLTSLRMAYKVHNFSMDHPLRNRTEEDLVIKTFMLFWTMPWTQEVQNNISGVREYLRTVNKTNPGWNDNMVWVEDVKQTVKYQHRAKHNPFSTEEVYFGDYPSMVHLVEQMIDGFGLFQDIQCRELKSMLMELEDQERNDGRVLLANFYRPYMKGTHAFFVERPEFLKQLGALDDSNPIRPSVMVPNFLYGPQFCLATDNNFQWFCCVDQCNLLMESLERSIGHPVAPAGLIAKLVAGLSSDTVAAPRNLSASLRRRLDLIAEQHGGIVPLHGRMFAQWLHHAFPNECPQPRAPSATEAPMTHDQWQASRNTTPFVSKEVMKNLTARAAETEHVVSLEEPSMLWTEEEELLTSLDLERLGSARPESRQSQGSVLHSMLRFAAMCAATASLIAILVESIRSPASIRKPRSVKGASSDAGKLPRWESAAGKSHFV